jgi:hypothetical protein
VSVVGAAVGPPRSAADPVPPEPRQDQDSGNNIGAIISLLAVSVNNKNKETASEV